MVQLSPVPLALGTKTHMLQILSCPYVVICCKTPEGRNNDSPPPKQNAIKILDCRKAVSEWPLRKTPLGPTLLTAQWPSHDIFIMHVVSWGCYLGALTSLWEKPVRQILLTWNIGLIWSNLSASAVKARQQQWLKYSRLRNQRFNL